MGVYVDGYVVPVPKKKIAVYRKLARKAGRVWIEHGARSKRTWPMTSNAVSGPRSRAPSS